MHRPNCTFDTELSPLQPTRALKHNSKNIYVCLFLLHFIECSAVLFHRTQSTIEIVWKWNDVNHENYDELLDMQLIEILSFGHTFRDWPIFQWFWNDFLQLGKTFSVSPHSEWHFAEIISKNTQILVELLGHSLNNGKMRHKYTFYVWCVASVQHSYVHQSNLIQMDEVCKVANSCTCKRTENHSSVSSFRITT